MTSLEDFNKRMALYDETISLWDSIPKTESILDEDECVDWTEDDWTVIGVLNEKR